MAEADQQGAPAAGPAAMLDLWEEAAGASMVSRAMALLGAARPDAAREELAALPIGLRDAELLDLHDRLFGSRIECTALCPICGETSEVGFDSRDIRTRAAAPASTYEVELDGTAVTARLPDSRDLAAIEGLGEADAAWQALVRRCIVVARRGTDSVPARDLPRALLEAVEAAAGEADPQADVVLSLVCPDCGAAAQLPFDIVRQAWARLDHWARAMFAAVDAIAARYGWTEAEILALGPKRRQQYLDLIGGAGR